jgi:pantoate--beta-alanine ligase
MSSRNTYLSPSQRAEAPRLYRTLQGAAKAIAGGATDVAKVEADAMEDLRAHGWAPDYVTVRRQSDLQMPGPEDRALVVLGAARLGATRLIDNLELGR